MKRLRDRLALYRQTHGVTSQVVERDYLQSWILAALAEIPALDQTLVFKGGTSLKKCFFDTYRFSEDLDFSGLPGAPSSESMMSEMQRATQLAAEMLSPIDHVTIECERKRHRSPHPGGQQSFDLRCRLSWQGAPYAAVIKVEVTMDEPILWPTQRKRILHDYEEVIDASLSTYALEEVVAEKLRALLQQEQKFAKRGWARPRERDYYDLWRVLGEHGEQLDFTHFVPRLKQKCDARDVAFASAADFFPATTVAEARHHWEDRFDSLVPDELPPFDAVIADLRPSIEDILRQS